MAVRKRIVIGNWKMHPETLSEAKGLAVSAKRAAKTLRRTDAIICPPALFLSSLVPAQRSSHFSVGAQDVFCSDTGSHTGEISPKMLKKLGLTHVIVGHSERRKEGETDSQAAAKVRAALDEKLIAVLCVGEKKRDQVGGHYGVIEKQLLASLNGVEALVVKKLIIAYEPLWAIGRSAVDAMTPEALYETVLFIRKTLAKKYGKKQAFATPVLYGGSVEPGNVEALAQVEDVQGFLVGHASLVAKDFGAILRLYDRS